MSRSSTSEVSVAVGSKALRVDHRSAPDPVSMALPRPLRAFTLVELMVSMAVLSILLVLTLNVIGGTSALWRNSAGKSDQFRQARAAFTAMTQNLRQATLASFLDYDNNSAPTKYLRNSYLHFIVGNAATLASNANGTPGPGQAVFFNAPLGYLGNTTGSAVQDLITAVGYYIDFDEDNDIPTFHKSNIGASNLKTERYRLMEFKQPASQFSLFTSNSTGTKSKTWFTGNLTTHSRPIADNIILLVIEPKNPDTDISRGSKSRLTANYSYDSSLSPNDNRLPPLVEITMVAISEDSAKRLREANGTTPPSLVGGLFQNTASFSQDLETLEKTLIDKKIDYRIFSSTIPMKEDT